MNEPSSPTQGPSEPWGADIRPTVAVRRDDRAIWWFAGAAVVAAMLLFSALEARRQGREQAHAASPPQTALTTPEPIPDLVLPANETNPALTPPPQAWPLPHDSRPTNRPAGIIHQAISTPINSPEPRFTANDRLTPSVTQPPLIVSGETGLGGAQPSYEERQASAASTPTTTPRRITAGRLENPATTVIQGTLINAVLETALDSTRPGQVRALVTRDVFGFDGTKLLIPRGTRLYGVYESDLLQGQKRAQIRWTRLLRPDGVTIALDSPAADPLGRAGVEGRVNNHFFQRLGNALIGASATIGSVLVTRSIATSPVVVAVPGATQTASQTIVSSDRIAPTLTIRQGVRITVFVQHDLDFSSIETTP